MAAAFEKLRLEIIDGPGNRKDVKDLVMFMTDGFPNPLTQDPRPEAEILKNQKNVRVVGIGVTSDVNEDIMKQIVSEPPSVNYQGAKNYRLLAEMTQRIIARTCSGKNFIHTEIKLFLIKPDEGYINQFKIP